MLISTALLSVIVYVLRQNCRAAGWWRVKIIGNKEARLKIVFSTVVYIFFFSLLDTLKPFLLIKLFCPMDDPSSNFSTVAMKIENRLSTLTNEIKENLSLLGDGCSLLSTG
jgi:hypothetical protein